MKRIGWVFLLFCTVAQGQAPLAPEQAFRPTARYIDANTVEVRYAVAPGHYLYRDKFSFGTVAPGIKLGKAVLPRGDIIQDEFFGKVEIYRKDVLIRLPASGGGDWILNTTSQGCAEGSICYPPRTEKLAIGPAKAP